MNDLVIYGSGGFAREVLQVALDLHDAGEPWNPIGFLDDDAGKHGTRMHDLPILGGAEWMADREDVQVVVAIGNTAVRRRVVRRLEAQGDARFATLVHPLAWVGRRVEIGAGTVICAGSLVTTDIVIGRHNMINLDCTVGHDSVLEDYVTANPSVNISGNVRVEEGVELGTGGTIIQGMTIGRWSIVGAGAVVVKDLPANVTAVGTPAKPIKEREEGWHE